MLRRWLPLCLFTAVISAAGAVGYWVGPATGLDGGDHDPIAGIAVGAAGVASGFGLGCRLPDLRRRGPAFVSRAWRTYYLAGSCAAVAVVLGAALLLHPSSGLNFGLGAFGLLMEGGGFAWGVFYTGRSFRTLLRWLTRSLWLLAVSWGCAFVAIGGVALALPNDAAGLALAAAAVTYLVIGYIPLELAKKRSIG